MRQLDKLGYEAHIKDGLITVSKDGVAVFVARRKKDQLYNLQCEYYTVSGKTLTCSLSNNMEIEKRMNFMNDRAMKCEVASEIRTHENPNFCGVDKCQLNCDVCITEKRQRKKRKTEKQRKRKKQWKKERKEGTKKERKKDRKEEIKGERKEETKREREKRKAGRNKDRHKQTNKQTKEERKEGTKKKREINK
jgi:hypothetical protein